MMHGRISVHDQHWQLVCALTLLLLGSCLAAANFKQECLPFLSYREVTRSTGGRMHLAAPGCRLVCFTVSNFETVLLVRSGR